MGSNQQDENKREISPMSANDLDAFLLDGPADEGGNREEILEPSYGNISSSHVF